MGGLKWDGSIGTMSVGVGGGGVVQPHEASRNGDLGQQGRTETRFPSAQIERRPQLQLYYSILLLKTIRLILLF